MPEGRGGVPLKDITKEKKTPHNHFEEAQKFNGLAFHNVGRRFMFFFFIVDTATCQDHNLGEHISTCPVRAHLHEEMNEGHGGLKPLPPSEGPRWLMENSLLQRRITVTSSCTLYMLELSIDPTQFFFF